MLLHLVLYNIKNAHKMSVLRNQGCFATPLIMTSDPLQINSLSCLLCALVSMTAVILVILNPPCPGGLANGRGFRWAPRIGHVIT